MRIKLMIDPESAFRFVMRMGDRAISGPAAKFLGPLFAVMASTEPASLEDALRIAGNLSEAQIRITEEEQRGCILRAPSHDKSIPFTLDSRITSDTSKPRRLLDDGAITIEYDGDSKSFVTPSILTVQEDYGLFEIDFTQRELVHRQNNYSPYHRLGAIKTALLGHPIPELCYEFSDAWVLYDDCPTMVQPVGRSQKVTLVSDKELYMHERKYQQDEAKRGGDILASEGHREAARMYDSFIERIEYKLAHVGK